MGIRNIIVYTHSEYFDVMDICVGQIKKYLPNYNLIILADKQYGNEKTIIYNSSDKYGSRVFSCLNQLDIFECIFMHEDMILYDIPDLEKIETCFKYIKNNQNNLIRLIYAGEKYSLGVGWLKRLENSSFTIQPTVVNIEDLKNMFFWWKDKTIYEIEACSLSYLLSLGIIVNSTYDGESKRGMFHYDSNIFPYIATAINKGKWNMSEYSIELSELFKQYSIDKNIRGIV